LEKLEMDKVCSVIVTATVHDAVHSIQDELVEDNDQVGWKKGLFRVFTFVKKILVDII
jgi:hypothetical protein